MHPNRPLEATADLQADFPTVISCRPKRAVNPAQFAARKTLVVLDELSGGERRTLDDVVDDVCVFDG